MTATTAHYDRPAVQQARREILGSRSTFWKPSDLDLPPSTAQRLLADLVTQGELRHLRKGLYWRGVKTPLGMAPPSPGVLAAQLVGGKSIGPAGLSAAHALRLSTQIPRRAEYAVVGRPPTDSETVHFVDRSARRGRITNNLGPLDVAALEVLDRWEQVIETSPGEAMSHLSRLIQLGTLDPRRLARASDTESGSSRARLRYLLHRVGLEDLAREVPSSDPRIASKALTGLVTG
ncbi:MAG: hypothetical protein K2Q25_01580 [Mycobacteriaceae bacterium]|nr:hypothetical protein [Mycobacteriaceae bacterium]